jgi:hypothetical protein
MATYLFPCIVRTCKSVLTNLVDCGQTTDPSQTGRGGWSSNIHQRTFRPARRLSSMHNPRAHVRHSDGTAFTIGHSKERTSKASVQIYCHGGWPH